MTRREKEFMPRYANASQHLGNFFKQAAQTTQQATDKTNEKVQRNKGHGLRNGHSFDTGINGDKSNRYQLIKQAIIDGTMKPTIRAAITQYQCSHEIAKSYFSQLILEGILHQDEKTKRYSYARKG